MSTEGADGAPTGFNKLLSDMNLNIAEFGLLVAFWVGMTIVSSFIGVDHVLSARAPAPSPCFPCTLLWVSI